MNYLSKIKLALYALEQTGREDAPYDPIAAARSALESVVKDMEK